MVERIANRSRDGSRERQEFFVVARVAGDEAFGHPIGSHRPPLVMIPVTALGEPDLGEVFEPSVPRNVSRGYMAMVIENRQRLSNVEVERFASSRQEQKILVKKRVVHG
jgi:hypothetical protein